MCNWRHGCFKRHTILPSGKRGDQKRWLGLFSSGLPAPGLGEVETALGQDSFSYWLCLWKAKGYSSEWRSGICFAYSFGRMKSVTPILVQVYEILDYSRYRRGKSKWFNLSLEWRPREVWSRLFVQIVVVVHNLLLPLATCGWSISVIHTLSKANVTPNGFEASHKDSGLQGAKENKK